MTSLRKSTPWFVLLATGLIAGGLLAGTAAAVPVTGWSCDPLVGLGCIITDGGTDSPTFGDGTTNSADNNSVYGSFTPVALTVGQQLTLSGQVEFIGNQAAGNGAFRWGLFKDTNTGDANPTTEWLGYLAQSASGNPADGQFYAKNPDSNSFTNDSFISTNDGVATWSGPYDTNPNGTPGNPGEVFELATGAGVTVGLDPGVYNFQITVGVYGTEVTVSATMNSVGGGPAVGDYNEDDVVDGADYTVWRDLFEAGASTIPNRDPGNGGLISMDDYTSWADNFGETGGGAPAYNFALGGGIDYNGNPPAAPVEFGGNAEAPFYTDHLTSEFDRVGFLFADHFNADQVIMSGIDVSNQDIEAVTLEVDTTTGASRIYNDSTDDFNMIYYEIQSDSDSLVPGGWTSIDDSEGDAVGVEWDEAGGSDEGILSEVNLLGTPFDLPAGLSTTTLFSLGSIWNTGGSQDLRFFYIDSNNELTRGIVQYVSSGAGAAVPEPATASLLWLGAVALLAAGRYRRE